MFQVKINAYNKLGKPCKSLLNIVDLAGSERRHGNFYSAEVDALSYTNQLKRSQSKKKVENEIGDSSNKEVEVESMLPDSKATQQCLNMPKGSIQQQ